MNSSPPYRPKVSLARIDPARIPATWRRTASPELCPCVSLIGLKRSMSMKATLSGL